jgi:urease accessory protein
MLANPVPFASPIVQLIPPAAIGQMGASAGDLETITADLPLAREAPRAETAAPLPRPAPAAAPLPRAQLWTALRVIDASFPRDGFSEVTGFEEAHRDGRVRDATEVSSFVEDALCEVGSFNVPFVRATCADPSLHAATDAVCDALMPNPLARRASRVYGRAFLSGTTALSPAASRLAAAAAGDHLSAHLAPAFGAVLGLLGAGEDDACRLFLYLGARGIFSAAMRLGLVGPLDCYARIAAVMPTVNRIVFEQPDDDRADVAAMAASPATRERSGAEPAPRPAARAP